MVAEGIEFQTGVHVGRDVSAKQLLEYNDAVVLCLGSTWPRDLNIPGLIFTPLCFASNFLSKPEFISFLML